VPEDTFDVSDVFGPNNPGDVAPAMSPVSSPTPDVVQAEVPVGVGAVVPEATAPVAQPSAQVVSTPVEPVSIPVQPEVLQPVAAVQPTPQPDPVNPLAAVQPGVGFPQPIPAQPVPTPQPIPAQPLQAEVVQQPAAVPMLPQSTQSIPFESQSGVMDIEFGARVSRHPIDQFKATTSMQHRVSVVAKTMKVVKTHYFQGVGRVYCYEGKCCEIETMSLRYLLPVVVYKIDPAGQPVPMEHDLKFLCLGHDAYTNSFCVINQAAPIDTVDLVVTCADEKYQKNTYIPAGPSFWRQNQQWAQAVYDKYNEVWPKVDSVFARKLDDQTLIAALRKAAEDDDGGGSRGPGVAAPQGGAFNLQEFVNK